jgi:hypothetical protein
VENNKPLYFYVANLGSEIQRVFVWYEKNDEEALKNAVKRSMDIIETIKSFGNKSANIEMDILSKFLVDFVSGGKEYNINRKEISLYFNHFALRVINSF